MTKKNGFQVEGRVRIALDALEPEEKATINRLLESKESFVAQTARPGLIKQLDSSKPLYSMRVVGDMRLIFTQQNGNIVVQDLMHKVTLEQFLAMWAAKPTSVKKGARKIPGPPAKSPKAQAV